MKRILFILLLILPVSFITADEVERDMVILEIGTGTWCQYCPGAALAADALVENGYDVAVIEYHNGDSFANTYSNWRIGYYGITGFPTAIFDGVYSYVGGSSGWSQLVYNAYLGYYNIRKSVLSSFIINIAGDNEGLDYTVEVTVEKVAPTTSTDIVLHFALTESEIQYNWQGQTELNFVERLMVPDQYGTGLDFSQGDTNIVELTFSLNSSWNSEHCEFVAFIQDLGTKEILQGTKVSLPDLPSTNLPPVANAGSDQYVNESDTVTLDGTGSYDPDGIIIEYFWDYPSGIILDDELSPTPSFTAPEVSADTSFIFVLYVIDDMGSMSVPDTVEIFVQDVLSTFDEYFMNIGIPKEITLYDNYPNPFNPVTTIRFSLPFESTVTIELYNHIGQKVESLINNEYLAAGYHNYQWNADRYASGVYFIRMDTPGTVQIKKAILLK